MSASPMLGLNGEGRLRPVIPHDGGSLFTYTMEGIPWLASKSYTLNVTGAT